MLRTYTGLKFIQELYFRLILKLKRITYTVPNAIVYVLHKKELKYNKYVHFIGILHKIRAQPQLKKLDVYQKRVCRYFLYQVVNPWDLPADSGLRLTSSTVKALLNPPSPSINLPLLPLLSPPL